jgi:hypothetical protein
MSTNKESGWSLRCCLVLLAVVVLFATYASARPIPKRGRTFSPEIGLYYQGDIMFMPGESFEVRGICVKFIKVKIYRTKNY